MPDPPTAYPPIVYYMLDVMQHTDWTRVQAFVRFLNNDTFGWVEEHGRAFDVETVLETLRQMLADGLVEGFRWSEQAVKAPPEKLLDHSVPLDAPDIWFSRTPRGVQLWEAWEP